MQGSNPKSKDVDLICLPDDPLNIILFAWLKIWYFLRCDDLQGCKDPIQGCRFHMTSDDLLMIWIHGFHGCRIVMPTNTMFYDDARIKSRNQKDADLIRSAHVLHGCRFDMPLM